MMFELLVTLIFVYLLLFNIVLGCKLSNFQVLGLHPLWLTCICASFGSLVLRYCVNIKNSNDSISPLAYFELIILLLLMDIRVNTAFPTLSSKYHGNLLIFYTLKRISSFTANNYCVNIDALSSEPVVFVLTEQGSFW